VTPGADLQFRTATAADYNQIIAVVDDWWGRPIRTALPRVFLDHFHATSTIAETSAGDGERGLAGFLIGFLSPSEPDAAYIHFVGVHPGLRGHGLARTLYQRFFALAAADGRSVITAITAARNARSIAFHTAMGFTVSPPIPNYDGPGYDGTGHYDTTAKVLFHRRLPSLARRFPESARSRPVNGCLVTLAADADPPGG